MSADGRPAVWLFHPGSGQTMQVSALSWDREQSLRQEHGPDIEGGLHGWFLANEAQAVTAELRKTQPADADPWLS